MDPLVLSQIKYGVREVSAFVGHSFDENDHKVVTLIINLMGKIGLVIDTGERAEASSVSTKVQDRIRRADVFVGIFTRRGKLSEGRFTTSPWVVEEKGVAAAAGKKLLLFVEDGVTEIGGLQGDYEYIRFNRENMADVLLKAIDYVLSITRVPLECRIDPIRRNIHINLGLDTIDWSSHIEKLQEAVTKNPRDFGAKVNLAKLLEQNGKREEAITLLQSVLRDFPQDWNAHHEIAHMLDRKGDLESTLMHFQTALDYGANIPKNYSCYGKVLYQRAIIISDATTRRTTLEKARRLLEHAITIGGEPERVQIQNDLFLVDEKLREENKS